MASMTIRIAETEEDVLACYPVVSQLRPHLGRDEYLRRVLDQRRDGYRMAFVEVEGVPVSVAGFRFQEKLATGPALYVDDLVTDVSARSAGHGKRLLDWLKARAGEAGCEWLELDSGVQRLEAHRFYDREEMERTGYHFRWRTR